MPGILFLVFTPPYLDVTFEGTMLNGTYTYSLDSLISCLAMTRIVLIFKLY